MRATGWSWHELQETPAQVVLTVLADMQAQGWAQRERQKWSERDARNG